MAKKVEEKTIINRGKEGYFIMTKGSFIKKTILNVRD